MKKGVRRLIRKPEKPHGKNWERMPQPMQSHKTSGAKGKKDTTLKIKKVNVRELR